MCVSRLRRRVYVTVCMRRSEDLLRCSSSLSDLFFSQGLSCFVCAVYSRQAGLQPSGGSSVSVASLIKGHWDYR